MSREGGYLQEFLVQQAFVRYDESSGNAHTACLLRDPLPLTSGKGASVVVAVGIAFAPTIREMGHAGIGVQHCVYDRALFDPLLKMTHQRQMVVAAAAEAKAQGAVGAPQSLQ